MDKGATDEYLYMIHDQIMSAEMERLISELKKNNKKSMLSIIDNKIKENNEKRDI